LSKNRLTVFTDSAVIKSHYNVTAAIIFKLKRILVLALKVRILQEMVATRRFTMQLNGLFSTNIELLSKNIDLRAKQQNLISSNLANAETPNYVPKALVFEDQLQGAIKGKSASSPALTNDRHLPLRGGASGKLQSVSGRVVETPAATPGKDGNAVELENEMARMMENQIMFNASVQILAKKFEGIKSALREGK
jgi:flagellar basal-body rod protein FlgB